MPDAPLTSTDYDLAQRHYVERYGSLAVMNTYLKIALLTVSLVALALIALDWKTYDNFRHLQPLVIRINDLGRAEAVNYGSLQYQPQEAEIKYFLAQFVHGYYGRMRASVRDAYPQSFYFLDGRLADAAMEANKKNRVIESFLVGHGDEIEIQVRNVAIEDLRQPPYKAAVEFEKVYYSPGNLGELRRVKVLANLVFVIKQPVPNALIPVNPLGLTITYLREDQAFQEEKP
jgi:type IV secretory pathway TrbF-like protein